jgi:nucleoside-diphosphate-sugar epimerase
MRVLFSLDNYDHGTGGAGMSARALAWGLAERGHEVEVLQREAAPRTRRDGPVRVQGQPLPRRPPDAALERRLAAHPR